MQTKLRVALAIGERVHFVAPSNTPEQRHALPWCELVDYTVKDGRAEWEMRTSAGHILMGRIGDKQRMPLLEGAWIALALPVQLHNRAKGLAPDFIFGVPSHYAVEKVPFSRAS